jgi:hypothetical protein
LAFNSKQITISVKQHYTIMGWKLDYPSKAQQHGSPPVLVSALQQAALHAVVLVQKAWHGFLYLKPHDHY